MMRSPACESWGKSGWHWSCAAVDAVHIPSPQGLVMVNCGAGAAFPLSRSLKVMSEGDQVAEGSSSCIWWDAGQGAGSAPIL